MPALATRSAMALALSLSLASGLAAAQQAPPMTPSSLEGQIHRVRGAVRNGGIYHLATGTWTRNGSGATANFGPDVVYANTATSGYFSSAGGSGGFAPGSTVVDEGALPTSLNTDYPGANRDSYNINCVELAYCDLGSAASAGWELTFYSNYVPCVFNPTPDATVLATGLPANGCWTIAIDLTGGSEFCLAGDGGDLSAASPSRLFGWGSRYAGTGTGAAGHFLAGDPDGTDPSWAPGELPRDGTETYYGPASLCPGRATGLYTSDLYWIEDPAGIASGCFFFGGYSNMSGSCTGPFNPYASFFLQLQADLSLCGASPGPYEYCQSNPNSTGVNSTLQIAGSASISANQVVLTATLPPFSFGYFLTSPTQGFAMNPGGSAGNSCLAGNIGRFVGPGQIKNSLADGRISLSTLAGEWSLAAVPAAMGPYAAVAGMETNFQLWHRDVSGPTPTSNFTDGYSITWID